MTTVVEWPSEAAERAALGTLTDLIGFHAARRPEKPALYFEGQTLTFREWNKRSNRIANGLIEAGCGPQTRIGYLGKNDSRYFEVMMGCAKSNTVLTAISWRLALPEIIFLLSDFDTELLFIDVDFLGYLDSIRTALPAIRKVVIIGSEVPETEEFDRWRDRQPDAEPHVKCQPDDVVLQLHTSGTTGRPKGAMLTNANVLNAARHAESGELGAWSEDDIVLVPLPLFHSGGTCWAMYAPYVGAANFITREANSAYVLKALASAPITKAGLVPAIIQQIINDPAFDRRNIQALKIIGYGGSPITVDLLRRGIKELGCGFIQMFGMTETATMGTTLLPEDHDLNRPELLTSCGKPLGDMEIKVVNANGSELTAGQTGEILLRSGSVMKGYYGKPEATAEVIRDGWYHSGDAGYLDEDGYLYIRDRIKDMIISGGENIYPAEVEQAMAEHPSVLEVGVVGVPSEKWGEEVKAFVALRPDCRATADELIAHARSLIASFKCPKTVEFLDALPRNPSGKILKRELRAPYWPDKTRKAN
ncbi:long-chain-fatty-acid--CoA ligase [Mesorhizobium sp. CGMCC 1.15528]|uniref:3-methylmercaptopropionyl-CoA ligase n=1 Tax=Mesorhizobium zhangyense TaxID=1776730 RepID=A0A7C9RB87_9HYPH|nr:long-chain-fatty-acid--CoA ligase [Mesorhizobium zhangyense]NGN44555.1 long-chain-fatty-acid--CoA ligase [Mesorhizobium zhangyense]